MDLRRRQTLGVVRRVLLAAAAVFTTTTISFASCSRKCDAMSHGEDVADSCFPYDPPPSPACCGALVAAVESGGGLGCLCAVAESPYLMLSGCSESCLLRLCSDCGGRCGDDEELAANACAEPPELAAGPQPWIDDQIHVPRPHA